MSMNIAITGLLTAGSLAVLTLGLPPDPGAAIGEIDVEGGTTETACISPGAVAAAGGAICGTLVNSTSTNWDCIFVEVVSGAKLDASNDEVEISGIPGVSKKDAPFDDAGEATVDLSSSGSGSQDTGVTSNINWSNLQPDGTGDDFCFKITGLAKRSLDGTVRTVSILDEYTLDDLSDSQRNGVSGRYDGVVGRVNNDDNTKDLTVIRGNIAVDGSIAAPDEIFLYSAQDVLLSATVTITGNTFEVTNFGGIAPGSFADLYLVSDTPLAGEPVRMRLEADFL